MVLQLRSSNVIFIWLSKDDNAPEIQCPMDMETGLSCFRHVAIE